MFNLFLMIIYNSTSFLLSKKLFRYHTQIEDISGRMTKFKIYSVGINQITFRSMDSRLKCVQICYLMHGEQICDVK